jgi:hypothetical protein
VTRGTSKSHLSFETPLAAAVSGPNLAEGLRAKGGFMRCAPRLLTSIGAEYNPVHRLLWLGSGNGHETVHYVMNEMLELKKRKDAPFSLNNGKVLHGVDTASGKFIRPLLGRKPRPSGRGRKPCRTDSG